MTFSSAGATEPTPPPSLRVRTLIDEINALTSQVRILSQMADEACRLYDQGAMQAPTDPRRLMEDVAAFRRKLEDTIVAIFEDVFGPRTDILERQMSMRLMAEVGPARFVQRVLWGEEISDIALTIALEKMIPSLERLVEEYPAAFLQQANEVLVQFKGK